MVPVEAGSDLDAGDGVSTVVADLTDPDDVARAVRATEGGAPLQALVNLVGGFAADQPVATTPLAEFERLFALNLRPTYLVTQAALPRLVAAGGGSIVCVGLGVRADPVRGAAGYAASKAAVIAFAKAVAAEGEPDGVRCNVILPTMIDTPANRAAMPESEWGPARAAGADREGHRVPVLRGLRGDQRRRRAGLTRGTAVHRRDGRAVERDRALAEAFVLRRFDTALNAIAKPRDHLRPRPSCRALADHHEQLARRASSRCSFEPTQCSATDVPTPSSAARAPAGSE